MQAFSIKLDPKEPQYLTIFLAQAGIIVIKQEDDGIAIDAATIRFAASLRPGRLIAKSGYETDR